MQGSLFDEHELGERIAPAVPIPVQVELAQRLPVTLRLGTSSWNYPGWARLVWDREYAEADVARHGLSAYARHPLFRCVSLDRNFYRPLQTAQYAEYAAQVPEDFRFVVKAPRSLCDAMLREPDGRSAALNPEFLDAGHARECLQSALDGLGHKLGVLVLQLSPVPASAQHVHEVLEKLRTCLPGMSDLRSRAPELVIAVEPRNAEFLTPALVDILREAGATYGLGLNSKMPPIGEQLPMLRALWPGPLVCRWNMNRMHGPYGYDEAGRRYSPYDRMVDPDLPTRQALAKVIAGTTGAGQRAFVTISNKAEGSAPLSVTALAEEVVRRR